jgi:hypothetical protein
MKVFKLFLAALFLVAMYSCTKSDAAVTGNAIQATSDEMLLANNSGPSANGQGGLLINDRVQHFAFHASVDKDGNVSGSWETTSPGQNVRTHGTITCLQLVDNNTAIMSGIITQRAGDDFAGTNVGDPIYFKVRDNGEGANSAGDQFTDYYPGINHCGNFNIAFQTIVNGNIQVKP